MAFQSLGKTPDTKKDWIQYDIAHWMQTGPDRQQTRALRGVGKSYICCSYAAWEIYRNPDIAIIVVSGATNLAQDFVGLTRKLMDSMEICNHLRPKTDDKDGAYQFVTAARTRPQKDPTVWACGVTSQKTGHHADLIIVDDAETPENSDDPIKREALLNRLAELEDLLNPGGRIVLLNTPQSSASVYLTLEKRGYACRTWPAEYPHPEDAPSLKNVAPRIVAGLQEDPSKAGEPTYPSRFSRLYLDTKRVTYGEARYRLQMLCDTRLADAEKFPLKLKDFIVHPCHYDGAPRRIVWGTSTAYEGASTEMAHDGDRFYKPIIVANEYIPYEQTLMFIDPSGGGTVSGDEVAWAIGHIANGMIFVTDSGGLMGGHHEGNMKHLARRAKAHNVKKVLVEGNYGKGMFSKLLAPYMADINGPTEVVDVYSSNAQKEKRIIDSLYTPMMAHRIVIDDMVAKDSVLMAQLTNITYSSGCLRHDDRVESLGALVYHLSLSLPAISPERGQMEQDKRDAKKVQDAFLSGKMSFMPEGAVPIGGGGSRAKRSSGVLSRGGIKDSHILINKLRQIRHGR